jgi:hypothetical protein
MSTVRHTPKTGARKVEYDLDGMNKETGAVPVSVFANGLPAAEASALWHDDPAELRRRIAQQMTGKTRGLMFNLAKRALRVETADVKCDGCKQSFPLSGDFTGWTYVQEDGEDYCADCSRIRAIRAATPARG